MTIKDKDISAALEQITAEGSAPPNMYHPAYGWIIRDGIRTESGVKFFEDLENYSKTPEPSDDKDRGAE